jgi:general secretion pathway protein E
MAASPHSAPLLGRRGRLELDETLAALVVDGYLLADEARQVRMGSRAGRSTVELHPLVVIANAKLANQRDPGRPLGLETLTEWLATQADLPYLKIDPMKINVAAVTQTVSMAYAQRHRILPVAASPGEITFATCEPFDSGWARDLAQMLRRDVKRVVSSPLDINRYLQEFYGVQRSIQLAQDAKAAGYDSSAILNFEQLVELGKTGEVGADDRHVVHIVDWLLQYAFEQRASDIHVEPRRDIGIVRFRIDGVLHQVYQIPMAVLSAMTSRIKILGRMDVIEKRRPQDGRIKTRMPDGQEVELRLATLPTAFCEKLVMRIFDPEVLVRDFSELGFAPEEATLWHEMSAQPNGIILVTGPTGSGKTVTLYSTLKQLATPEVNVCTLEDPIEMIESSFNQVQILPDIGMGFAEGIRSLMRQDPDIIMVGEIRDLETADMAIQAALTGHLVLSTLHTNDAPSAMTRLIELGVPPYMLSATVLGVMAQRLIRTLCPHCKQPGGLRAEDEAAWTALVAPWKSSMPAQIYRPAGCLECRMTGYKGRVGIYEIMPMSAEIKKLVAGGAELARLREQAMREGMKPLRIAGARKVAAGLTTIAEIIKVAPPMFDTA